MEQKLGSVRGDLIRWARMAQDLTMRGVKDRGGPCLGYQSEVENAKKAEVRSEVLAGWIWALNVTESFVRGHMPRYLENPVACRGLAADVGELIQTGVAGAGWKALSPLDRTREVLALISLRSEKLPRVVLAYVLGLELTSLDATITGGQPVVHDLMQAIGALTGLPDGYFKSWQADTSREEPAGYAAVFSLAQREGVTPEELQELLQLRHYLPDMRRAAQGAR